MADPAWSNVLAQLQCDGANLSTTITDSSSYGRTIAAGTGNRLSTTQSKYGGASLRIGGTGAAKVPDSSDFDPSGPLTFRFYARFDSVATGQYLFYCPFNNINSDLLANSPTGIVTCSVSSTGVWRLNVGNTTPSVFSASSGPSSGVWYEIAVVLNGTSARMFVNGTRVIDATPGNLPSGSTPVHIGASAANASPFTGYTDDFEISAEALYTTSYAASTKAWPTTTVSAGSASGTGSAASSGALAIRRGAGTASGTGAASAPGSSASASGASAAGHGTASAAGEATAEAPGAAAGLGRASGTAALSGSAAGVGAGNGAGLSTAATAGQQAGVGSASGASASSALSFGVTAGLGLASAAGESTVITVGAATGQGTAAAVAILPGVGVASGHGAALGAGLIYATSVGFSVGTGRAFGNYRLASCFPRSFVPITFGQPIGPNTKSRNVAQSVDPVRWGTPTAFRIKP